MACIVHIVSITDLMVITEDGRQLPCDVLIIYRKFTYLLQVAHWVPHTDMIKYKTSSMNQVSCWPREENIWITATLLSPV
jgi:hypothetical protein